MPTRIVVVLAGVLIASAAPAMAQMHEHAITVSGEATADVAPDYAVVTAGVSSRGKTAREASDATNRAMQKVLDALRAEGIAERDVRTEYLSLQPLHEAARSDTARIIGFQASNSAAIKVRDTAKIAGVLDRVIAAGANDISGISFGVSEQSVKLDDARAAAVADARRKAAVLAKAADVRLGPAIRIVEGDRSSPGPMMMRAAAAPSAAIAPGEQTLRASVSVTFELMN